MTAVIGMLGLIPPILLTFTPVPITLQTAGLLLAGGLLKPKQALISLLLFLLIVAAGAVVGAVIYAVRKFLGLPTEQQLDNLKEWLKWAVTQAEKELGSGTGQLKLRMVYDMAVEKFPWLVRLVPFEEFSMWVDEALLWLNKQLESNKNITNLVKGGED